MRCRVVILLIVLVVLVTQFRLAAAHRPKPDANTLPGRIPLGINGFLVRPAQRSLYLLGTAFSRGFQGWRIVEGGHGRRIVAADGSSVRQFPSQLQFRVTASAPPGSPLQVDRDLLDWEGDLNQFLLDLGFRLKIFHGLKVTALEPDSVELIGMPADVLYDERVYRVSFTLPPVPIEDRLVLEVLDPRRERLCKFHLDF